MATDGFEGRYETSVTVDVCCLNTVTGANVLASTATKLRLRRGKAIRKIAHQQ